ncbi:MAG: DUF1015 domain-containing protein [Bacillota bacterium]
MAGIIPIRGWRYGSGIKNLAAVVTPPYDVIDRAAQKSFYARHPNNIIRLEYGAALPGDDDTDNRYTRAAEFFKAWRREGVLKRDAESAFYFYEQTFTLGGDRRTRRGFFCGLELEPYGRNVIPHEETLSAAKVDRARLIQTCEANFSPIFALYSDPQQVVERLFTTISRRSTPACDFIDEEGQTHRLWVVTDKDTVAAVTALLAGCKVLIADGHHRFETALHYSIQRRPGGNPPEKAPYDYILTFLVNTYDPGLVILPTHRIVKTPADFRLDRFLSAVKESFVVTEIDGRMPLPNHRYAFGLYTGNKRSFNLVLKEGLDPAGLLHGAKPPVWKRSSVAVLHALVLDHLKIGPSECTAGEMITYTHDPAEAAMLVDTAVWDLAFLLYPPGIDELVTVAQAGEKMPQKSTYFYPKAPTGLVVYSFAE